MTFPQILYEKWWKNFFGKIFEFVPKLPKFWQGVDPKKKNNAFFFSNLAYYIFLERKFNFQYNGENFKCMEYQEQKLFKFKKTLFFTKNIWCTDYFADVSKNWHVTGQFFLPNCLLYNGLLLWQILFHLHKWLRNKRGGGGAESDPPASTPDQSSPPLIGLNSKNFVTFHRRSFHRLGTVHKIRLIISYYLKNIWLFNHIRCYQSEKLQISRQSSLTNLLRTNSSHGW